MIRVVATTYASMGVPRERLVFDAASLEAAARAPGVRRLPAHQKSDRGGKLQVVGIRYARRGE